MQVCAIGAVVLAVALAVDFLPGLLGLVVKPVRDIGAGCFDEWLGIG